MKKMPRALRLGDIDSNLTYKGEICCCVEDSTVVGFSKDKIKRWLMLMREIPRSTLSVERAHGSTASILKLRPMKRSGMNGWRSMLHMSRALFLPDAEDPCVMNLQKVIEQLRGKRPRKMSWRQAYFRALMLEVSAVPRSAAHSSQALKEKIMAQNVKLFDALSPPGNEGRDTMAADLSCATWSRICTTMFARPTWSYRGLKRARRVWPDTACQHDSFGILRLGRAV